MCCCGYVIVSGCCWLYSSVATIYNNLYYCWATTTTTIFIYNTINISTKITERSRIHIFHSKVGSHRKKSLRLVIIMQFSVSFFSFFFVSVYICTRRRTSGKVKWWTRKRWRCKKEMVCVILRWQGRLFWLDDYRIRW